MDLADPLPEMVATEADGSRFGQAHVLVRYCDEPLAWVDVPLDTEGLAPERVIDLLWAATSVQVVQRLRAAGLPATSGLPFGGIRPTRPTPFLSRRAVLLADPPSISVVLCTRGRAARLPGCLAALERLEYPRFEVVVVDNAATDDSVARVVDAHSETGRIRVIAEPRPGLARARNTALGVVTGQIVAFIDDDELPDRHWLTELVRGFHAAPDVAGVSGPMLPLTLDTPAQCWFERFGGHGKGRGFQAQVFDPASHSKQHPLYPLPPFGTGGNMAFTREALAAIGGFDTALGAGTPAHGAEDTAAIYDVMTSGGTFVYQPSAVVWHSHRSQMPQLADQLRGYGTGLTAFYTRAVLRDPRTVATLLRMAPTALHDLLARDTVRTRLMGDDYPRELEHAERVGLLTGPFAYLASRRLQRRLDRTGGR